MSRSQISLSPTELNLDYNLQSSFNLTSIINSQQLTPRSLSQTLIDFISQKINPSQESPSINQSHLQSPQQFSSYLNEISGWLQQIKSKVAKKYQKNQVDDMGGIEGITRCYTEIPYVFFEKQFVLKMDNYGVKDKMKEEQEELNQFLDLIQINLFCQVNSKFNDFYQALSNFEDLEHRVEDNINRLTIVRTGIPIIKRNFTQKADKIMKILQYKANKQAVLRHLTIMRSLNKLPPTIKTILESPLPHQSLSLLSTGKSMYSIVKNINSMKSIGDSLDKSDNIIKHSLYKSFSDKFFLYITTPLNAPFGKNFESTLSISSSSNKSDNSQILEFYQPLILKEPPIPETVPKTEEELVITIMESCDFVDFVTGSRIKAKVLDHSKLVSKQFFQSLKSYLVTCFSSEKKGQKVSINENLSQLLDKVPIQNYSKVLQLYHKNYKMCLRRLLSTLQHLYSKLKQSESEEYIDVLQQLFYLFSGILKIICDETSQFISLKKLSKQISIQQFKLYLNPLSNWIEYIRSILSSPLFSEDEQQETIKGFEILEYKNKIQLLLEPLVQTKGKLQDAYITNLHMSIISHELKSELEKETWVPVEDISYQYLTLFNYIFNKNQQTNQSGYNTSFNNSFAEQFSVIHRGQINNSNGVHEINQNPRQIVDIKLFKNGIILDRKIFKTTSSFLRFCEIFEKYLKIQELFPDKRTEMIMRLGDISTFYSSYTIQLIVYAGALKFNLVKTKNITVKHLCLLWCNFKILLSMLRAQKYPELQKVINQIESQSKEIIKKMSYIIDTKVQMELANLYRQGLGNSIPANSTNNIINSQKQMIQITEEYLDEESIKSVMTQSVNLMIKKFLQFVESKGERGHLEGKYYVESMKVLEISFENQMEFMKKILKL